MVDHYHSCESKSSCDRGLVRATLVGHMPHRHRYLFACAAASVIMAACAGIPSGVPALPPPQADLAAQCRQGSALACEQLASAASPRLPDVEASSACKEGSPEACIEAKRSVEREGFGRSIAALEVACGLGRLSGCAELGVRYDSLHQRRLAAYPLTKACNGGMGEACKVLGHEKYDPNEIGQGAEAAAFYEKACHFGDARGCEFAGLIYARGLGVPPNMRTGLGYLERGCRGENWAACYDLGVLFTEDSDRRPSEGEELYRKACDHGHRPSCEELAASIAEGARGPANCKQALSMVHDGCARRAREACAVQGYCEVQTGAAPEQGQIHLRDACGARSARACAYIGELMDTKKLSPELPNDAARYHEMACRLGSRFGCFHLAKSILGNPHEQSELGEATQLLHKSCSGGLVDACVQLADLYSNPHEGMLNPEKARVLREKACQQGRTEQCAQLGGQPL